MTDNLSSIHFNDLKALNPDDVIERTGCRYDAQSGHYEIRVWNHDYIVSPDRCEVIPKSSGGSSYHGFLYLFILHYLIKGQSTPPSGTWVSEKDIPGGEGFFRGPHLIPVQKVVEAVKDDTAVFAEVCKGLAGTPIDFADAAFCFQITPVIPVAVLFWQGDEDFPGEAKMLFDKTIDRHFALDIIYALAVEICATVVQTAKDRK